VVIWLWDFIGEGSAGGCISGFEDMANIDLKGITLVWPQENAPLPKNLLQLSFNEPEERCYLALDLP
jgi:hypothetical protein